MQIWETSNSQFYTTNFGIQILSFVQRISYQSFCNDECEILALKCVETASAPGSSRNSDVKPQHQQQQQQLTSTQEALDFSLKKTTQELAVGVASTTSKRSMDAHSPFTSSTASDLTQLLSDDCESSINSTSTLYALLHQFQIQKIKFIKTREKKKNSDLE
ncbi:unnamed protein product [Onchocerca flexuosa]|uniref:Uncharacterized protein n=1 Tax=Onchocerca flexuosa TaxID=387005 RepID=A0A183HMA6_9BILA|nr:unnamed protein product [Onchocerca flexuosa]